MKKFYSTPFIRIRDINTHEDILENPIISLPIVNNSDNTLIDNGGDIFVNENKVSVWGLTSDE